MYPKTEKIRQERRAAAEQRNARYEALTLDQKIEEQEKARADGSIGKQLVKLQKKRAEQAAAKQPAPNKRKKA